MTEARLTHTQLGVGGVWAPYGNKVHSHCRKTYALSPQFPLMQMATVTDDSRSMLLLRRSDLVKCTWAVNW